MKPPRLGRYFLTLVAAVCLVTCDSPAHLPKPLERQGEVLAIDRETQTLVLKPGKGKKPFLLRWTRDTKFAAEQRSASASDLKEGMTVTVQYRKVAFHNPVLTRVVWTSPGK